MAVVHIEFAFFGETLRGGPEFISGPPPFLASSAFGRSGSAKEQPRTGLIKQGDSDEHQCDYELDLWTTQMQSSVSPEFGVTELPRPPIFDPSKGSADACPEREAVAIFAASDSRARWPMEEAMSVI